MFMLVIPRHSLRRSVLPFPVTLSFLTRSVWMAHLWRGKAGRGWGGRGGQVGAAAAGAGGGGGAARGGVRRGALARAEGRGVLRLRLQAVARRRRDGCAAAARVREDHVPGPAEAGEQTDGRFVTVQFSVRCRRVGGPGLLVNIPPILYLGCRIRAVQMPVCWRILDAKLCFHKIGHCQLPPWAKKLSKC